MRRRDLLKIGALSLFGLSSGGFWASADPVSVPGSVVAHQSQGDVLVVVFLRGGLDGMHALVPYQESEYYRLRPRLALPRPDGEFKPLRLDEQFAFNPALRALLPHYREGTLAPVCAVGTSDTSRSHFIAQDYLELGGQAQPPGWLNRHLQEHQWAVSTAAHVPTLLQGPGPVLSARRLDDLEPWTAPALEGGDPVARLSRQQARLRAILAGLEPRSYRPALDYPDNGLAEQLKVVAFLLKQGVELGAVHCELEGFDSHSRQILAEWPGHLTGLNRLLYELAGSLDAFWRDLGPLQSRVTIMTVTEFGRRLAENGSLGTDHGLASCSLVMGAKLRGGRVHGRWPGLAEEGLVDGMDLPVTTDYRQLLSHYCAGVGSPDLFPDFASSSLALF